MSLLAWALLADGGSDRSLLSILRWAILDLRPELTLLEPSFEVRRTDQSLEAEIRRIADREHPDLLFVHRDAERKPLEERRREVPRDHNGLVRVVPVRMTEAWLLVDEQAIRAAASNPRGTIELALPDVGRLERLPDPKEELRARILKASELSGRRLDQLKRDLARRCLLVAEEIGSFDVLLQLTAFRAFRDELEAVLSHWNPGRGPRT